MKVDVCQDERELHVQTRNGLMRLFMTCSSQGNVDAFVSETNGRRRSLCLNILTDVNRTDAFVSENLNGRCMFKQD